MNPEVFSSSPDLDALDATLRSMAALRPPAGLEARLLASLQPERGQVIEFPHAQTARGNGLRAMAAAILVSVVLGGGWGIVSRVPQAAPVGRAAPLPTQGGFSNAGAIRAPQTLVGPEAPAKPVDKPAVPAAVPAKPAEKALHKLPPAPSTR